MARYSNSASSLSGRGTTPRDCCGSYAESPTDLRLRLPMGHDKNSGFLQCQAIPCAVRSHVVKWNLAMFELVERVRELALGAPRRNLPRDGVKRVRFWQDLGVEVTLDQTAVLVACDEGVCIVPQSRDGVAFQTWKRPLCDVVAAHIPHFERAVRLVGDGLWPCGVLNCRRNENVERNDNKLRRVVRPPVNVSCRMGRVKDMCR